MGRKLIDLTGQRFEKFTVKEYLGRFHHSSLWRCVCDCGEERSVQASALKSGPLKSCGCFKSDRMRALTYKHGERGGDLRANKTPEYKAWDTIKQRCCNPEDASWSHYGGRGITICDLWIDDAVAFMAYMGKRSTADHSVERIDNFGNYEPGNVKWATRSEQCRNRRSNRIVDYCGEKICLVDACEKAGLPYKSVKNRIYKGWSESWALSEPISR